MYQQLLVHMRNLALAFTKESKGIDEGTDRKVDIWQRLFIFTQVLLYSTQNVNNQLLLHVGQIIFIMCCFDS